MHEHEKGKKEEIQVLLVVISVSTDSFHYISVVLTTAPVTETDKSSPLIYI